MSNKNWHMLMFTGRDKPGIVSTITQKLYALDCMLGECSMQRLGCSFTIMLMVESELSSDELKSQLESITADFDLYLAVKKIKEPGLYRHREPDYRITVHGADQAGIVARVTKALAEIGANIIDLESIVAGQEDNAVYVLTMEIALDKTKVEIQKTLDDLKLAVTIGVHSIDSFIG